MKIQTKLFLFSHFTISVVMAMQEGQSEMLKSSAKELPLVLGGDNYREVSKLVQARVVLQKEQGSANKSPKAQELALRARRFAFSSCDYYPCIANKE